METKDKPHVLIAGAGIGGLTLAQCLRAKNHPFTIFERDASSHSRAQGWAIALHTVLSDLIESLPSDMPSIEVTNHLLPLSDIRPKLCFYDQRLKDTSFFVESRPAEEVGFGEGRVIRSNRDRLREWLATNVDIQWGKQAAGFQQDDNGVTLHFADGTTARGDILVSAEGVRSAIRQQLLPDVHSVNVPDCFVTGEINLKKEDYEKQMKIGPSAYAVMAENYHLFVGLNKIAEDASSADYYWDVIWHDDARSSGAHWIDSASPEELYDFVARKTAGLGPQFTEIIKLSGPHSMKTPPLVLRDLVLEDMPLSRVTLVGDAAHAMVPFRGEGGCHAIDDAIKLAKVLTSGGSLAGYQKEMLARGSSATKASRAAGSQEAQTGARKAWGQPVQVAHSNTE